MAGLHHAKHNRDYDKAVLLLDTDPDWSDARVPDYEELVLVNIRAASLKDDPAWKCGYYESSAAKAKAMHRKNMKRYFRRTTGIQAHDPPGWGSTSAARYWTTREQGYQNWTI